MHDRLNGMIALEITLRAPLNHHAAHELRGMICMDMGREYEAIFDMVRAVNTAPHEPWTRRLLGLAHFNLRQWHEAAKHFKTALILCNNQLTAHAAATSTVSLLSSTSERKRRKNDDNDDDISSGPTINGEELKLLQDRTTRIHIDL
jgi:tetratricopeptide (TPR) repeat protein